MGQVGAALSGDRCIDRSDVTLGRANRRRGMGARDRGLLLVGVVAVARALWVGDGSLRVVPASLAGEGVPLRVERLAGPEWRLLPGVGPVLAGRLERARLAAGGSLSEVQAEAVPGVGPALIARWRALRPGDDRR